MPDIYNVPERVSAGSPSPVPNIDRYREAWAAAQNDPDAFWLGIARRIAWAKEPTKGLEGSFLDIAKGPLSWFGDGELNVTVSCIDRHLAHSAEKTAIL